MSFGIPYWQRSSRSSSWPDNTIVPTTPCRLSITSQHLTLVQYVFAQHSGCAQFLWFERANEDKNLKFEEKDKERALCDNMDMVEHRLKELVKLGPKPIRFLRGHQETDWAVVAHAEICSGHWSKNLRRICHVCLGRR